MFVTKACLSVNSTINCGQASVMVREAKRTHSPLLAHSLTIVQEVVESGKEPDALACRLPSLLHIREWNIQRLSDDRYMIRTMARTHGAFPCAVGPQEEGGSRCKSGAGLALHLPGSAPARPCELSLLLGLLSQPNAIGYLTLC